MKHIGLGLKILLTTFLILLITVAILIYFSYRTSYLDLQKTIGERLEAIATTAALMIDGDLHDQIQAPEDANSEAFKRIQEILRRVRKQNRLTEEIYTFRQEGNKLKYITMSHQKNFIGHTYPIRQEMWPALNEGKSSHTPIYRDEHGIWISAYAPIMDSNGQVSGMLDVDIRLETFQEELRNKIGRLVFIGVLILVSGLLLSFLLSRRMVRNLKYLTSITEKISTGMVDHSIKIKGTDEVGKLAQSLERMRISLRIALELIEEKEREEGSSD